MKLFKNIPLVLMLLFIIAVVALRQFPSRSYLKAMRLSKAVSSLPLDSNESEVASLFKKEGVDFFYNEDKDSIDNESAVKEAGYSSSDLRGFGGAGLHYTSYRWFPVFARYMFFFDKKGKMLKATVNYMTPAL